MEREIRSILLILDVKEGKLWDSGKQKGGKTLHKFSDFMGFRIIFLLYLDPSLFRHIFSYTYLHTLKMYIYINICMINDKMKSYKFLPLAIIQLSVFQL